MKDMISLIVPFYNASKYINTFLNALSKQELDEKLYEVIFIDNNSADDSCLAIRQYSKKHDNVRCISYIEKATSYAARNYGVFLANNDILVFTDIDCRMDTKFLLNIYKKFTSDNTYAVAGKISIEIINKKNCWELYDSILSLDNERLVKKNGLATANLAVSKELFNKVGNFSEFISSGDVEWAQRLVFKGFRLMFDDSILVYHPSRKSYEEVSMKLMRTAYGRGQKYGCMKKSRFSLFLLMIIYSLKSINIYTLLYLYKRMKSDITLLDFFKFSVKFTMIRFRQINAIKKGFLGIDTINYNK